MKALFILGTLALSVFAEEPRDPKGCPIAQKCTPQQKKAQACYEIYAPVLGVYEDKTYDLFSNDCEACATDDVYKYYRFNLCDPSYEVGGACTKEYLPVCGYTNDGELKQYGNKCMACSSGETHVYLNAKCPKKLKGQHDD